jgi:hypothetical protein
MDVGLIKHLTKQRDKNFKLMVFISVPTATILSIGARVYDFGSSMFTVVWVDMPSKILGALLTYLTIILSSAHTTCKVKVNAFPIAN